MTRLQAIVVVVLAVIYALTAPFSATADSLHPLPVSDDGAPYAYLSLQNGMSIHVGNAPAGVEDVDFVAQGNPVVGRCSAVNYVTETLLSATGCGYGTGEGMGEAVRDCVTIYLYGNSPEPLASITVNKPRCGPMK